MYGGITFLGWFHTILGIAAILTGLFLLIKENFISIKSFLGRFYLVSTAITAGSSLFIYNSTGSFNIAHLLSVITILAILFAIILHKVNIFGLFNLYLKELALSSTVFFSMLPTTAEVLKRLPPQDPFVDSIDDPLVIKFYIAYVFIYGVFALFQIYIIKSGNYHE